jgi:prepilin-type N-terminal cleavage/methylation domain-containing protein
MKQWKESGMTLVELSVSLFIVSILGFLTLSGLRNYSFKAKEMKCAESLRGVGVALHLYAGDHQFLFPPEDSDLNSELLQYGIIGNQIRCPAAPKHYEKLGISTYTFLGFGTSASMAGPENRILTDASYFHRSAGQRERTLIFGDNHSEQLLYFSNKDS